MQRNGYTADEMRQVYAGNFSRVFGISAPGQTMSPTEVAPGE
jgi:hypothetical protein